jgi:Uma2 family endonuclease
MSTAAVTPFSPAQVRVPQPKRWSVAQFHALFGEPTFGNHQFMLIEGEILEMPIPNPPHSVGIDLAAEALRAALGGGVWIRTQMPLVLGLSTDPMPDLAVVKGSSRDFTKMHPRTALLVVEIAESTLAYDIREKANIYAAGGIADYWVVDLVNRQLHIFRDPTVDAAQAFGTFYRSRQSLAAAASASPLAVEHQTNAVRARLP